MGPDWLESPQHFVAGVLLALAVVVGARWKGLGCSVAAGLAIGVTATAEIAVELVEYPLVYDGKTYVTAYWDTLADLAATMVGALVGTLIGVVVRRRPSYRVRR